MSDFKKCITICDDGLMEYFPPELIDSIRNKVPPEDLIYKIIYNYMIGKEEKIDVEELLKYLSGTNIKSFRYTPIVIFILEARYNKYFVKEERIKEV